MAYIQKETTDLLNAPSGGTVLGTGGVLGAATGGTTAAGDAVTATRQQTSPGYVSGQQYLEGNVAGAQKLAGQIVNPLKEQASQIEDVARAKALSTIGEAGVGPDSSELLTKAGLDARTLSDIEKTSLQGTLAGTYGGPTDVDYTAERTGVQDLQASADLLGTSAGVNQALTGLSGGQKYTSGMRNFDAMLMRQDPSLRTQLEAQAGLGERVTGTIDEQRQAALEAIATGQATAGERGIAATDYLQGIATGQEGAWTDALGNLRTSAGGIADIVAQEGTLSDRQLNMIGLDQSAYDQMRDAYVASSYGRDRPLTYAENYSYNLNSPTQFTAANAYTADAWRNFQLDPYTTGLSANDIGYQNVVDQESLAKYQALNALRGGENIGWAPQTALSGNLEENALNFNNIAAQQALANFMKSGVAAPRSNLDYMEGMYGPGGYLGWTGGGAGRTPGYTKTGADIQTVDPLTGQDPNAMTYIGAKSPYGYATDAYNPAAYSYDRSVDQAMLDERALRSGYAGSTPLPTTYTPEAYKV